MLTLWKHDMVELLFILSRAAFQMQFKQQNNLSIHTYFPVSRALSKHDISHLHLRWKYTIENGYIAWNWECTWESWICSRHVIMVILNALSMQNADENFPLEGFEMLQHLHSARNICNKQ